MTQSLQMIIDTLELHVLTNTRDFDQLIPESGYTSDLLSCVMAGAKKNGIWITLQAHANIVAVAALLELAAIIITENAQADQLTIERANEQGVTLLSTSLSSFAVAGKLWEIGLRES
jgi:hypothetical protein